MSVRVPIERKSAYDPNGDFTAGFTNDLGAILNVFWVDYEGNLVDLGVLAPEETQWKATNSEHPWVFKQDDKEVACFMFVTPDANTPVSEIQSICANAELANAMASMTQIRQQRKALRHHSADASVECECDPNGPAWKQCREGRVECEKTGVCYEPIDFKGFTVFIADGCMENCPELQEQLSGDLAEITRLLPEAALEVLRENAAIWIDDELRYDEGDAPRSGAVTHWGPGWVNGVQGDHAGKGGCVEVYQAKEYVVWVKDQPSELLHELTHAYHFHRQAEIDSIIKEAYDKAMATGIYDNEERGGVVTEGKKPYSATNHAEYFAESSEAFWSSRRFRNDFFPYLHCELRGFDPIAYEMCETCWGIKGDEVPSRGEIPDDWLNKLAKVSEDDFTSQFQGADANGDGTLCPDEFKVAIEALVPTIGSDEIDAAFKFADADGNGTIHYQEFTTWLTAVKGAKLEGMDQPTTSCAQQ